MSKVLDNIKKAPCERNFSGVHTVRIIKGVTCCPSCGCPTSEHMNATPEQVRVSKKISRYNNAYVRMMGQND